MTWQPLPEPWLAVFERTFRLCGVQPGDVCAVLSEQRTRPELPALAQAALARIGARVFALVLPQRAHAAPVPVRSTGASDAIGGLEPVIDALARCAFFADCTVEGLMHASELPRILAGGARGLYVSHEHPEILERCVPEPADEAVVRDAMRRLKAARTMHVSSAAGTELTVDLSGARIGGVWGYTARPGTFSHWPGGLVLAFPAARSVNGKLVLDRGDVNLTFKRYLQSRVTLTIERDHAVRIDGDGDGDGDGVDALLMRETMAAWNDPLAAAVSHVGWGLNRRARRDALAYYDKADFNGTELRAWAGNFLYSTGANEVAGRHTLGHFDLPLAGCSIALDGALVVDAGRLV